MLDDDLTSLTRDELSAEVRRLRGAIRTHRDSSGHELCWHHPELWALLPEQVAPQVAVPPWPQFLRGCVAYRQSLERELPDAPQHLAEFNAPQPIDISEPIFDAEPVAVTEPIVDTEPIVGAASVVVGEPASAEPIVGSASALVAEPVGAEPAGAEPSGAEPAGAEPSGAEPSGAEPSGAEPSGAEPEAPEPEIEPETVTPHHQLRSKLQAAADQWPAQPAAGGAMDTTNVLRQAAELVDQLTDTDAAELLAALEVDDRVLLRPALMFGISPEQVFDVIRRNTEAD